MHMLHGRVWTRCCGERAVSVRFAQNPTPAVLVFFLRCARRQAIYVRRAVPTCLYRCGITFFATRSEWLAQRVLFLGTLWQVAVDSVDALDC